MPYEIGSSVMLKSHFAGKTGGSVASLMDADPDAPVTGRLRPDDVLSKLIPHAEFSKQEQHHKEREFHCRSTFT